VEAFGDPLLAIERAVATLMEAAARYESGNEAVRDWTQINLKV
jgi:hypothetical protein